MKAYKQDMKPIISVIIPSHNEEANIEETLRAVKNQKCDVPYEIILIDGQSTDKTIFIAKKYAKVFKSPQRGKTFQLNYVVPKTKGELLVFLDADTLIDSHFLQKIYKIFEKKKDLIACSARVKYYDGHAISFNLGSQKFTITPYFILNLCMHIFYFIKTQLKVAELMGCNIIVRRDIFFKVGGFKQLPSNLLGIDKVFSDSLIHLIRKTKKGTIKTLNFISVLTSARFLSTRRSIDRIIKYHSEKEIYDKLATDTNWKN
ncbi:MAG: glycosyltransferase family 2 protein [Candidatus Thorarchaeota archaeon]